MIVKKISAMRNAHFQLLLVGLFHVGTNRAYFMHVALTGGIVSYMTDSVSEILSLIWYKSRSAPRHGRH